MLFSSYEFLLAFLPVTAVVYFLLSKIKSPYPQRTFLAAASLFFYSYFEWRYFFIIAASVVFNFICAKISLANESKGIKNALFLVSAVFNIALIGYYKYYDFTVETVNAVVGTDFALKHILLPLGISFFTFQQISFQIRTYKTNDKELNFIDYTLFVSFFPQLIAGPIVLYEELEPQIKDETKRFFNAENFAQGIYIFTVGLFKKILIADSLAVVVDNGFSASTQLGLLPAWICALAYTFQIYFDFCGYSEMAIGLGKMFNYELPVNFETPYKAASIGDFWKRWHVTLGRSLHSFVYVPLGGNRNGKLRKCINLFLTFVVSGIWHGASWTFIIWGIAHGVARVVEEVAVPVLNKIPVFIKRVGTFVFVVLAWVVFRAESLTQAKAIYAGMFNFGSLGLSQFASLVADGTVGVPNVIAGVLAFALVLICVAVVIKEKGTQKLIPGIKLNTRNAVICALFMAVCVLCMSRSAVFIYFNF